MAASVGAGGATSSASSSSASASSGSTGGSDATSTSTGSGACTTDADNDGAISWQCAGGNDCADQDARAHPGATFATGGAIQGPKSPGTLPYDFNCDQVETTKTLTLECTGMPCSTPSSVHGFQQAVSCGSTGMLGHCGGLPCEWISEGITITQACK